MQHDYDAIIVGAGGAGLWAAPELARAGVRAAVLTQLYPTRSHTGAAQGGVCAALGNLEEDHWEWHMFDTVKGGDYLVDQDPAEVLSREAIECVIELEHMGLPFTRTDDGRIDQRRFGGHTRNFGEAPVKRACYAADRTGHMIRLPEEEHRGLVELYRHRFPEEQFRRQHGGLEEPRPDSLSCQTRRADVPGRGRQRRP